MEMLEDTAYGRFQGKCHDRVLEKAHDRVPEKAQVLGKGKEVRVQGKGWEVLVPEEDRVLGKAPSTEVAGKAPGTEVEEEGQVVGRAQTGMDEQSDKETNIHVVRLKILTVCSQKSKICTKLNATKK